MDQEILCEKQEPSHIKCQSGVLIQQELHSFHIFGWVGTQMVFTGDLLGQARTAMTRGSQHEAQNYGDWRWLHWNQPVSAFHLSADKIIMKKKNQKPKASPRSTKRTSGLFNCRELFHLSHSTYCSVWTDNLPPFHVRCGGHFSRAAHHFLIKQEK